LGSESYLGKTLKTVISMALYFYNYYQSLSRDAQMVEADRNAVANAAFS